MTKGEYVAREIRDGTYTHKYHDGDKLPSEAELCALYQVSRTSIRNAIQILSAEGLINTYHGKGSFVNSIKGNAQAFLADVHQIGRMDMFEFRRVFEAEGAFLAANRADESVIEALRGCTKLMQQAESIENTVTYDMEFHYLIANASKNAIMPIIFEMLRPAYRRMFFENVACRGVEGYKEHLLIISAIESRNPEQARLYMTEHLNKSMMQNTVDTYMQAEKTNGELAHG